MPTVKPQMPCRKPANSRQVLSRTRVSSSHRDRADYPEIGATKRSASLMPCEPQRLKQPAIDTILDPTASDLCPICRASRASRSESSQHHRGDRSLTRFDVLRTTSTFARRLSDADVRARHQGCNHRHGIKAASSSGPTDEPGCGRRPSSSVALLRAGASRDRRAAHDAYACGNKTSDSNSKKTQRRARPLRASSWTTARYGRRVVSRRDHANGTSSAWTGSPSTFWCCPPTARRKTVRESCATRFADRMC